MDVRQVLANFVRRIRIKLKSFKHKYNSIARNYVYFNLYGREGAKMITQDIFESEASSRLRPRRAAAYLDNYLALKHITIQNILQLKRLPTK